MHTEVQFQSFNRPHRRHDVRWEVIVKWVYKREKSFRLVHVRLRPGVQVSTLFLFINLLNF